MTGRNGPPSVQTMIAYATLAYESRGHVVVVQADRVGGDDRRRVGGDGDAGGDLHTAVYAFTHPQAL